MEIVREWGIKLKRGLKEKGTIKVWIKVSEIKKKATMMGHAMGRDGDYIVRSMVGLEAQ